MSPKLPGPDALIRARAWLLTGAPVAHRDHDAPAAVRTLLDLLDALPARLPEYAWGSPEWRAAAEAEERKPTR